MGLFWGVIASWYFSFSPSSERPPVMSCRRADLTLDGQTGMTFSMPSDQPGSDEVSGMPSVAFREASSTDLDLLALMNAELLEFEIGSAPSVEILRGQIESGFDQGSRAMIVTICGMPAGYALYTEKPDLMYLQHFLIRGPWRMEADRREFNSARAIPRPRRT